MKEEKEMHESPKEIIKKNVNEGTDENIEKHMEEKTDENIEKHMEEKKEENIEKPMEEKTEENIKENTEEHIDEPLEESLKGTVKGRNRHGKCYTLVSLCLLAGILLLGILSCFHGFCDWYIGNIYGVLSDCLTTITDPIPFCLGEVSIYLGIFWVLYTVILLVITLLFHKRKSVRRYTLGWLKSMGMVLLVLLLIYMSNWVIPFRSTTLVEKIEDKSFTLEEIQTLRNYMVQQLNDLAYQQSRDENNHILYPENIEDSVIKAMKNRAEDYPLLGGKYPHIKIAGFSRILDFMGIGGYTYPYTMEVTCNKYVDQLYFPYLMAHEHCHHQGFYQEDEADFYAFIALMESEDPFLQYSAYDSVYYQMNAEYQTSLKKTMDREEVKKIYNQQPKLCAQVGEDELYSLEQSKALMESEKNEVVDSFSPYAEEVADVGWSVQEDLLAENYYDGVVELLLDYYRGKLY